MAIKVATRSLGRPKRVMGYVKWVTDFSHPKNATRNKDFRKNQPPGISPPGEKFIGQKISWTKSYPEKSLHVKIQLGKNSAVKKKPDYKPPGNMPSKQKKKQAKKTPQ